MKIIFFITRADTIGGAQIHVRDLAKHLAAEGHNVKVITGETGVYTDELTAVGVSNHSLKGFGRSVRGVSDLRALVSLIAILKTDAPDIISLHSVKAGVLGRIAAFILRLPCVFTAHGWSHIRTARSIKRYFFVSIERFLSKVCAQRIITVAHADYCFGDAHLRLSTNKLRLVHNGMPDIWGVQKRSFDFPLKLTTIARFQEPKDFYTLLEALALLKEYEWVMEFIGDGPDMIEVQERVKSLGLHNQCVFLGRKNDAGSLLLTSDIYILSSLSEGLPRSIIEAMGAGLPVVASDVGGVSDLVLHGQNGFLFKAGNSQDLKDKLKSIFDNPSEALAKGRRSREIYEQEFSFAKMFEKTKTVYAELVPEINNVANMTSLSDENSRNG